MTRRKPIQQVRKFLCKQLGRIRDLVHSLPETEIELPSHSASSLP